MKKTTREWVRKAEADCRAARKLHRGSDRLHDQTCFCCQQCAEKYLTGLLEELGLTIPHTHILKDLLALLAPHYPSMTPLRRGLVFLTRFAVGTRYPGSNASKREAEASLRWSDRVRAAARALLGLRLRPRRRK
jgi:HEPN domain-containing protein